MGRPSKEGLRFNDLCDEHWDRFGVSYGAGPGDTRTLAEHIMILEEALRTGVPARGPQYNLPEGVVV